MRLTDSLSKVLLEVLLPRSLRVILSNISEISILREESKADTGCLRLQLPNDVLISGIDLICDISGSFELLWDRHV